MTASGGAIACLQQPRLCATLLTGDFDSMTTLTNLQLLDLDGTLVLCVVGGLKALTSPRELYLYSAQVKDNFFNIRAVTNLQTLGLGATQVTKRRAGQQPPSG